MHYLHALNKEFNIEEDFHFDSSTTLKEALKVLSEAGYMMRVVFDKKTKLSEAKSIGLSVSGISEVLLDEAATHQDISKVIFNACN